MDDQVMAVFNAVANNRCATYQDIADHSEMNLADVSNTLVYLRKPENALQFGFTIPHVKRGRPGIDWNTGEDIDRRFVVVGLDGAVLEPEDRNLVRLGCWATMGHTTTMCYNESHALSLAAKMAPDRLTKTLFNRAAKTLDFIADTMAEALEQDKARQKDIAVNGATS
jgi:hypothetical protein